MAFGWPTRYIQLDPAKIGRIPAGMSAVEAWDAAVDEANREYCKRMHNICCDNCHHHVGAALTESGRPHGLLSSWFLCCLNGNCTWCHYRNDA